MSNQWFYNPNYPPPSVPYMNREYQQQKTDNTWSNGTQGPYVAPACPPAPFNVPPPGFYPPPPHFYQPSDSASVISSNSSMFTSGSSFGRMSQMSFTTNSSCGSVGYSYSDELESYRNSKASLEKESLRKRSRERSSCRSRSRSRYSRRSR